MAPADEWRQWRGAGGQGVSNGGNPPVRWSANSPNVRWKTPVDGLGNSSPIVSGGRVFLTTSRELEATPPGGAPRVERILTALDLETGELLWERVAFTTDLERRHPMNTPAGPTPVADDERVYVYFGMGLAAYDHDGELVWKQEVDPHYVERSRYGVISSPVLAGDAVVVVRDDEWGGDTIHDISWLAAYDRRSGRRLWRSENDETCCSYATPILREGPSGTELIFPSTPFVAAYDPDSGDRLWTAGHELRQIVTSPLLIDDLLVLPGSVHEPQIVAMRLVPGSGTEGETRTETVWAEHRSTPKIPSAVAHESILYTVTDRGILAAYDLETGDRHYSSRLASGNYRASLAVGGGRLYALSDGCTTSVIAPGPRFRLLAENPLPGHCAASPAIAGGAILVRTADTLYCIERTAGAGLGTAAGDSPAGTSGEVGEPGKKRGKGKKRGAKRRKPKPE